MIHSLSAYKTSFVGMNKHAAYKPGTQRDPSEKLAVALVPVSQRLEWL